MGGSRFDRSKVVGRFRACPFSRREADAIISHAPPGSSFKAVDLRASRATATGPELAQYRIVHFATHGVLDSRNPALSGIVLSLVDRQGKPVDGFLRLWDIYNLRPAHRSGGVERVPDRAGQGNQG